MCVFVQAALTLQALLVDHPPNCGGYRGLDIRALFYIAASIQDHGDRSVVYAGVHAAAATHADTRPTI